MLGGLRLWCLPCAHGSSPPLAGYEVAYQCGHALLIDALRTWQGGFNVPLLSQRHRDDKIGLAQEYLLLETDYSQSPHAITHKSGSRSHLWTQALDLLSMTFAEAVYGRDCKPLICRNRRTYG